MKFLAVFMTILMLASGLNLCADAGSCDNNQKAELHSQGQEQQSADEMCSPFCHCARCAFSILLPEKIKVIKTAFSSADKFSYVQIAAPIRVSSSIWQPPKHT